MSSYKFFLKLFFYTGLFLLLSGCGEKEKQSGPVPGVVVIPAVYRDVVQTYQVVGQVIAYDDVDLRARVEGFLEKRNYSEGQMVKKSDLLFVIEKAQYQAEVDSAEANLKMQQATLEKANLEYERIKTLYAKRAVSKRDFDNAVCEKSSAEAKVLEAKASLETAKLNLSYTDVKAPFDGKVGIANYSVGNVVGPSDSLLANIVKINPIKVEFNLPEDMVVTELQKRIKEKYSKKDHIVVKLLLPNGTMFNKSGKIEYWNNRITASTGTIMLRAVFENPDFLLLPGLYVKVYLETEEKHKTLLIPASSIQEDQTGDFVLAVDNENKVKRHNVKTGDNYGMNVAVKSGLKEGEKVIVEGLQKVRPGIKVKPVVNEPYSSISGELGEIDGSTDDTSKSSNKNKSVPAGAEDSKAKDKSEETGKPENSVSKEETSK